MESSDYLRTFIAQKRSSGVSWQHIAAMSGKSIQTLQPYIDLEAGYKAAAIRDQNELERKLSQAMQSLKSAPRKRKSRVSYAGPTPEMRLAAVKMADHYNLDYDTIIGHDRQKRYSHARQHLMWKLSQMGYSTTVIAKFMSKRDHTTIVHGIKTHMARNSIGGEK